MFLLQLKRSPQMPQMPQPPSPPEGFPSPPSMPFRRVSKASWFQSRYLLMSYHHNVSKLQAVRQLPEGIPEGPPVELSSANADHSVVWSHTSNILENVIANPNTQFLYFSVPASQNPTSRARSEFTFETGGPWHRRKVSQPRRIDVWTKNAVIFILVILIPYISTK